MTEAVTLSFLRRFKDKLLAGQYINAVNITGGIISNVTLNNVTLNLLTPLPITSGGTGANTAPLARTALGLAIGTNVQAYSANLDTWATKTPPSGAIVGTTDSQALTNKTYNGLTVSTSTSTLALNTANAFTVNGAFPITLTAAGTTTLTLPLSGTLVTSGVSTLSSLVSIGTITTGVWNGTVVAGQYGGTGVANTGKTITLGGNLTTSGAFATTLTATNTTTLTLPTTGTLATLAGNETLTTKTISGASNTLSNIALTSLSTQAANTFVANGTAGAASPTAIALSASQLAGRGSAGNVTAIALGTGLSMSGNTLNASGVTKGTTVTNGATYTINTSVSGAHGLPGLPQYLRVYLKNISGATADGYATAAEVNMSVMGPLTAGTVTAWNIWADATNVYINTVALGKWMDGTSRASINISPTLWQLCVDPYYYA